MPVLSDFLEKLQKIDPTLVYSKDKTGVIRRMRGRISLVEFLSILGWTGEVPQTSLSPRSWPPGILETLPKVAESDAFGRMELSAEPKIDGPDRAISGDKPGGPGGFGITFPQKLPNTGIQVFGGNLNFHISARGEEWIIDRIENRLVRGLEGIDKEPNITDEEAIQAARKATHTFERDIGTERTVYKEKIVIVVRFRGVHAWVVYVDASDGRVVEFYDDAQQAAPAGVPPVGPTIGEGVGIYSGAGPVNTYFTYFGGATYELRDATRSPAGPDIRTGDVNGPFPSTDRNDKWDIMSRTPRSRSQGPDVDAHRYAGKAIDYFSTIHGYVWPWNNDPQNCPGGTVDLYVHYDEQGKPNVGRWDPVEHCAKLGDGDGKDFGYCCEDDWLAHELTHAYTQKTCALQYKAESGALNEAISDTFAAYITSDWLIFEKSFMRGTAPAFRNMKDPTNGGKWVRYRPYDCVLRGYQPSHYDQRYMGAVDNFGVHINSGIINNLFFLLTEGGTHAASGITVGAIGQQAAERLLFYCMKSGGLNRNPAAKFLDFRQAMLDAWHDLAGDPVMLSRIKAAFKAVGVGPDLSIRKDRYDTGDEPYGGDLGASPDIITRYAQSPDPKTQFANMRRYWFPQHFRANQPNYVYIRVKNLGNSKGDSAIASVYLTQALNNPGAWQPLGVMPCDSIAPGATRILGPFGVPAIPAGDYSVIATVNSFLDPAPDVSPGNASQTVLGSNNIAVRNVTAK